VEKRTESPRQGAILSAEAKPKSASDLQWSGRAWALASITRIPGDAKTDDITATSFKVKASDNPGIKDRTCKFSSVIFRNK